MTLDMANGQLSSDNDKFVDRLETLILNNGSKPTDVEVLGTLKDILFSQLEDVPEMRNSFSESIEAANLGLDVEPMDAALSGMEYYSEVNNQKESQLNYLMWKMNKLLVQRELIQQVSLQIGTHDLSFSVCCGVNVTSNMNKQNVGKEVSIVLTNPTSGVEMTYRDVKVMNENVIVDSEITLIDDVAIVRFTPTEKGDYKIKFESVAATRQTTNVEQQEVTLGKQK